VIPVTNYLISFIETRRQLEMLLLLSHSLYKVMENVSIIINESDKEFE